MLPNDFSPKHWTVLRLQTGTWAAKGNEQREVAKDFT